MGTRLSMVILGSPTWLVIVVCTLLVAGVSMLGLLAVRRRVSPRRMKLHHDVAGFIFSTLGVIYAVLLAFVVLIVWQELNDAQTNTNREAAVALSIDRTIGIVPDAVQAAKADASFHHYVSAVVDCEFPRMAEFASCPESTAALIQFWHVVADLNPQTMEAQNVQAALLSQLTEMQQLRRVRQAAIGDEIPAPIWAGVLLGGLVTIGFSFFFGSENLRAQMVMTACLGAMVGLVIAIIILLEHPFAGEIAVQAEGFRHILSSHPG